MKRKLIHETLRLPGWRGFLMAMLFVFGGLIAVAQTTQITGTVTDAITNEPIPGHRCT
jgi:hypothetical protein